MTINPQPLELEKTMQKIACLTRQSAQSKNITFRMIISELGVPVVMADDLRLRQILVNLLGNDPDLLENCRQGDPQAVRALMPVFDRLQEIMDQGYTDYKTNCTYPEDNYDGSIMTFFEGKVPFYVCNAECVSGMKKRESKSETFTEHPFEYELIYAPVGDKGAYAYTQPWYGFAINKDSDSKDMSVEFLRFMAQSDKLQEMHRQRDCQRWPLTGQRSYIRDFRTRTISCLLTSMMEVCRRKSVIS